MAKQLLLFPVTSSQNLAQIWVICMWTVFPKGTGMWYLLLCTSFVYWHPQCMKNWRSVCVHSLRRSPLWGHLLSFQLNNLKKETDYWSLKVVPHCQGTEKTARRFWTILLAGRNMLQGRYVMKFKVQNIRSLLRDHTSTGQKAKTLSIRNLKRKCPALQKIVHD